MPSSTTPKQFDQFVAFYYTANLTQTAEFYQNILGLKLALDQGTCQIYQINPHAFIGFCEKSDLIPSPDACILTLVTQQVDQEFENFKQKGVPVLKPPTHNPEYNIYHCFLKDPNGYKIEIQQFLDPNWK